MVLSEIRQIAAANIYFKAVSVSGFQQWRWLLNERGNRSFDDSTTVWDFLEELLSWKKREKKRKETLFKCQVYLALRHINWGHCKLKLLQNKFNQMQVFEERGKPEFSGENLSEQRREPTNSTHIWRRVWESSSLVGGECSHHYATTEDG